MNSRAQKPDPDGLGGGPCDHRLVTQIRNAAFGGLPGIEAIVQCYEEHSSPRRSWTHLHCDEGIPYPSGRWKKLPGLPAANVNDDLLAGLKQYAGSALDTPGNGIPEAQEMLDDNGDGHSTSRSSRSAR